MASEIYLAELKLWDPEGNYYLYVTLNEDFDGKHFTVSKASVFDYLTDITDKAPKLSEEYNTIRETIKSKYAEYFKIVARVHKLLG